MKIIIINKDLDICEKDTNIDECYKKCNYRKADGFSILYTWDLGMNQYIDIMGRISKTKSQQYRFIYNSKNSKNSKNTENSENNILTLSGLNAFTLYKLNNNTNTKEYLDLELDYFKDNILINSAENKNLDKQIITNTNNMMDNIEKEHVNKNYTEQDTDFIGELVEECYVYSDDDL